MGQLDPFGVPGVLTSYPGVENSSMHHSEGFLALAS